MTSLEASPWTRLLRRVMGSRDRVRARLTAVRRTGRAWVRRFLPNETQHLFARTLAVGVVCGLVAVAFHLAIRFSERLLIDRATHAGGSAWMVWTILTPTLGGLLAGAALTMALFVAQLAFSEGRLLAGAKVGVLAASGVAAVLALALGRMLLAPAQADGAAQSADEAESATEV